MHVTVVTLCVLPRPTTEPNEFDYSCELPMFQFVNFHWFSPLSAVPE